MCSHWMPSIKLALTPEQYQELPRHSGYKYEYLDGFAYLSPRAKHYHALLDLRPIEASAPVQLRPVHSEDFVGLRELFAATFARIQPFGSLDDATRETAVREALERTRSGGDGPWIERASFVAELDDRLAGAVFITLLPEGDPTDRASYYWETAPPPDCIEKRQGQPHLTWIFVDPVDAGQDIGTTLLSAAVRVLLGMGFTSLLSTFMIGNDSSMLWHWRNGFRLLPYPLSYRLQQHRRQQRQK